MIIVPYSDQDREYGQVGKTPAETGDIIVIDRNFDKNNRNIFYKIIPDKNGNFVNGIDWDSQLVHTVKMGVNIIKTYIWHFSAISRVMDGNEEPNYNCYQLPEKIMRVFNKNSHI